MEIFLTLDNLLLLGSLLLLVGVFAGKLGYSGGMPILLAFLFIGMLFGNEGLGIKFDNPNHAQFIGVMALSIILFSGGMSTKYSDIMPIWKEGVILATFGVLATTVITGIFIYGVANFLGDKLSLGLPECFLLAAVMSSTDSASVFSLLRSKGMDLPGNLRSTLELESGSNDPMAYVLTILFIQICKTGEFDWQSLSITFGLQMAIGFALGFILAKLVLKLLRVINLDNQGLYSVLVISTVFFTFSFTEICKGNGYLAVYIFGLVLGNSSFSRKRTIINFFEGFTWLWQVVMFLALGLLVNPSELMPISVAGILIGLFMTFAARPLAVFASLIPFKRITFKEKLFVSWVGLKGAVPIIFATYVVISGTYNSNVIFNIVFFITILSLLLQGTTISLFAKMLGLSRPPEAKISSFDIELPDDVKAAMSEIEVNANMLVNGNRLMNIKMPAHTLAVMVKRKGGYFIPTGSTELEVGDKVLVISDKPVDLLEIYKQLGVEKYAIQKNDPKA